MALLWPSAPNNCSSQSIRYPDLPDGRIRALEASQVSKGWQYIPAGLYSNNPTVSAPSISFCNVTVTYTRVGSNRNTTVQVWLPTAGWNSRIQAIGGGGWNAGLHDGGLSAMTGAVIQGYTAIGTDGGYPPNHGPEDWDVLRAGKIDLKNFQHYATTSLNDLSIVGKAVVQSFYGQPAKYSYWNGCSQGGRQGHTLAQKYPKAFDGIVASAPVVNWGQLMAAGFWAQTTMNEMRQYPHACELNTLTAAAIKACDGNDGLVDGLISDPDSCKFDPTPLINTTADCGFMSNTKISPAAAHVAKTGWFGMRTSIHPYMWTGTDHEAGLVTAGSVPLVSSLLPYLKITTGLADTECAANGTCYGKPFNIVDEWIKFFVLKDQNYDTSKIDVKAFDRIFDVSVKEYSPVIGTDSPDLSAFRDAGGKLMMYHGLVS
jgi:hypothetical protein